METIKVFTCFSGYDSQCIALQRIGIPFDLVGWSEIDTSAIAAHNALFPDYAGRNFGDITKIAWKDVPDFDMLTYSFPCQDISLAGNKKGFKENSKTRSALLWNVLDAIVEKTPDVLIMENVQNIMSQTFINQLNIWAETLQSYGYINSTFVLYAPDFGIPQNRSRCFMVSTRNRIVEPDELKHKQMQPLTCYLEENVEDNFFVSDSIVENLVKHGVLTPDKRKVRNTLTKYVELRNNSIFSAQRPACKTRRGRAVFDGRICPTIMCKPDNFLAVIDGEGIRFRTLTPRETFRLMGLNDDEINRIMSVVRSKHKMYRLAGNSIVVDVMASIFEDLYVQRTKMHQLSIFDFLI